MSPKVSTYRGRYQTHGAEALPLAHAVPNVQLGAYPSDQVVGTRELPAVLHRPN